MLVCLYVNDKACTYVCVCVCVCVCYNILLERSYFTLLCLFCLQQSKSAICIHIGEGNGNPPQDSDLENSMGRRAWWATIRGLAKRWTRLND